MDLITQLPNSRGYDAILTIIDHKCTQVALFFPFITKKGSGDLHSANDM